ncbi:LysR substrate-binding domain-containing protein [Vibrio salinus]|uniref:LysR substrate-binding domain-containing protein n=1 Tax=Vibrio salinus TaxID=2899784 RepID=UPI001E513810|nr:LysR substrate-binding domain-containing protein [Vibrio salinus]MCE0494858.1 LysR substrate-binding domain-containing protein [Vibrio salinus]MCE0496122.1 LysR substrate-binding domain-containing protein [Vibrio salinus]
MNNIETKWLKDFLALSDVRSFSQAAEIRNVTQPAFSRRIKSLESELGVELVFRGKTPIELTVAGRQFKSTAISILGQLEEEANRLSGSLSRGCHTVRLSAVHSIAITLLPKLHESLFKPRQNSTRLAVVANEVKDGVDLLVDGKCDFLFSFYEDKLQVSPYRSIYLGKSYLYCVSGTDGKGNPLFSLDNDDNAQVPCLDYTPESYMGRIIQRNNAQLTQNSICSASMTNFIKALALNGQGVCWLPDYSIRKELEEKKLVILTERKPIAMELYIYRYHTRLHETCETIWNELKQICPIKDLCGTLLVG